MERAEPPSFLLSAYLMLTKPGIIIGNGVTTIGGFALASHGYFNLPLLLFTLGGLSLVIASACVLNNYVDREADKKMKRTRNRPLARGIVQPRHALIYAALLGFLGVFILAKFTTIVALLLSLLGFLVYIALYTLLKYRLVQNTLIGSIAGAIPPVVGYTAVSNRIDLAAFLLFGTLAFWQMPHFFAIAVYRLEDYLAASILTLPIRKGMKSVKVQMLVYIAAFTLCSSLLNLCGYTNRLYLFVTLILGGFWLFIGIKGFWARSDQKWARQMFIFSLVSVMTLSIFIPFCVY